MLRLSRVRQQSTLSNRRKGNSQGGSLTSAKRLLGSAGAAGRQLQPSCWWDEGIRGLCCSPVLFSSAGKHLVAKVLKGHRKTGFSLWHIGFRVLSECFQVSFLKKRCRNTKMIYTTMYTQFRKKITFRCRVPTSWADFYAHRNHLLQKHSQIFKFVCESHMKNKPGVFCSYFLANI